MTCRPGLVGNVCSQDLQDQQDVPVGLEGDLQTGTRNIISEHDHSQETEGRNRSGSTHVASDRQNNITNNTGGDYALNIQSCGVVNFYGHVFTGGNLEGYIDVSGDVLTVACHFYNILSRGDSRNRSQMVQSNGARQKENEDGLQSKAKRDDEYQVMKNNLRQELVDHYSSIGLTNTSISVLFDEDGIDVDDINVMPELELKRNERRTSIASTRTKETISIGRILQKDGKAIKRACIVGEAGYGKTFICKKIVSSWCKIHSSKEQKKLTDTDIAFLKSFEFLFYLPLRNCQMTDVIDMIKEHIVRKGLHGNLQEILEKETEKCLILLDGLDEYSSTIGIPIIDTREKYSIILTTRPWKIESLRPNQHDLGQEFNLKSIQQNDDLIKAVVGSLNDRFGTNKDWMKFKYMDKERWKLELIRYNEWNKTIWGSLEKEDYKKMEQLAQIPVMLIQMICMWYDGEGIGNKRTEIYKQMLEYLFKVAHKQRPKQMNYVLQKHNKDSNQGDKLKFCPLYDFNGLNSREKLIISKLAELAYLTLFGEKKEDALIFSHDDMEIYDLSEEEVGICLTVGLLSQEKNNRKITKQEKVLSFIHKTYQEFLAAIYVAIKGGKVFNEMLIYLDSVDQIMEMSQVLIFLVGLKQTVLSELKLHIDDLVENDERVKIYRKSINLENSDLIYGIQGLICGLLDECKNNESVDISFELRDIHIDQHGLDEEEAIRLRERVPFLDVHNAKSLYDNSFKDLSVYGNMKQIQKLVLEVNTQMNIDLASDMISNSEIDFTCLDLRGPDFSYMKADVSNLFDKLSTKYNLTALSLQHLLFNHESITIMCSLFSKIKQLQELLLYDIKCYTCDDDQCEYTVDLRQNVRLGYIYLSHIDGDILLDTQVPLEYVVVGNSKHGIRVLEELRHSITLKDLYISHFPRLSYSLQQKKMIPTSKVISDVLPTLHNLESFELSSIDIEDESLILSSQTKEMKIYIGQVIMTLKCMKGFIESALQASHSIKVNLVGLEINPKQDVFSAAQYIRDHCHIINDWRVDNNDDNYDDNYDIDDDSSDDSDDGIISMEFTNGKKE